MKTILVPTDFSLPARWAVEAAVNIARRAGVSLILLHVIERPIPQSYNVEGEIDLTDGTEEKIFTLKLIEKQREELNRWVTDFQSDEVMIIPVLRLGNTFHGISRVISEQGADLVVMGTTGHSLFEKLFLGSNTDKVIRFAKCPVLTIHRKPPTNVYKDIVYATSLEDCETSFATIIKTAQLLYGATIHLVRINTPENFSPDPEVRMLFNKFIERMGLTNYTVNIFNDKTTEDGIVRFAESIDADLIGMAAHGRSLLKEILTGNTAGDVANHSQRPVLTYVTRQ